MHPASTPETSAAVRPALAGRLWIYQRERFPVVAHGVLIAAFSFCAVSLSRALRGDAGWPHWPQLLVAFGTCFTFFLQLRIADEFKDFAEDARYRPYRPVQRGLVTLRELGVLFVLGAAVQFSLAIWLNPKLIVLLAITWTYLAAMSKLVDLYATSTDWLAREGWPPRGLIWFLMASYCNGLVIEIGRKIRSPQDEEEGVDTYSRLWGRGRSVASWWGVMAATFLFAVFVAFRLRIESHIVLILGTGLGAGVIVGVHFLRQPFSGRGKWIETYAGIWTLMLYLSLGLLPHAVH
jgi:4-hydroxybenzoate polyprenyltransferase